MTQDAGGGVRVTRCHAGHQFYKDTLGDWQDVDYTLVDQGAYWELTRASYRMRIAKDFGAPVLLQYTNRFDGANHSITYEPHSIWWINANNRNQRTQARTAQSVIGTLDPATNTITWAGAFGAGVDFEVVIQRSGFRKNIVINAQPSPGPYASNLLVPVFVWDAVGLTLRDQNGGAWDNNGYFEADEFTIEEIANPARQSFVKQAYAIDATGREKSLRVIFEKRAGQLWQGKLIPENLLQAAVYPVRADTVTTAYASAGDGKCARFDEAWATLRETATSITAPYTATTTSVNSRYVNTGNSDLGRMFLPFDTSAIGSGDTISAADLNLYVPTRTGSENIVTTQSSQASLTALVVGDFDALTLDTPDEGATRAGIGSFSTSQYNTISLNATGIGWIGQGAGGTAKFVFRTEDDVDDVQPTATNQLLEISTSEETGTSQDPYLEVTHAAAGGPGAIMTSNKGFW